MKKILIVEDDEIIAQELQSLLNNAGYVATIFSHFENALEEILKEKVDLILLDINILHINGEFLLQEFRKQSSIPIIMVTSRN